MAKVYHSDPDIDALIRQELRYGQTRWAEVWMAVVMVAVGFVLLAEGDTFSSPSFRVISQFVTEEQSAWIAIVSGSCRLVALKINGDHTKTPIIRTLGCIAGFLFWSALTLGFWLTAPPYPTGIAVYGVLAVAELHASGRAARDAYAQDSLGTRQRRRERERTANLG